MVGGNGSAGPGAAEWLAIARRAIAHAERLGADQAEALVLAERSSLTRFANSEIHQNVAEANAQLNLRFVRGKRIGVASTDRLDDESLRRAAERAGQIASVVEELDDFVSLPEARPVAPVDGASAAGTADATPEMRAEGVRAVIGAADAAGVVAYGAFSTTVESMAVATTLGIGVGQDRTGSQLLTVMMGPDGGTGYAERAAVDASTIDASAIGHEAAEKARASANAIALEPGDYPVVLEEYAVVDILDMLGYVGFSALAVQEGRSFWEKGKRVGSELVTIVDDGADPAGLPSAFDFEGVPKERVTLIDRGVCDGL
ncbi:MAG TPA: metallopeptidase TldD-related protein, partial [Candidatus Limnocylindrales bacterium]